MNETKKELEIKIENYKIEVAKLEEKIRNEDSTKSSGRIVIVEANSKIKDYNERIERLTKRINGIHEDIPTEAQVQLQEWVLSDEYDEL